MKCCGLNVDTLYCQNCGRKNHSVQPIDALLEHMRVHLRRNHEAFHGATKHIHRLESELSEAECIEKEEDRIDTIDMISNRMESAVREKDNACNCYMKWFLWSNAVLHLQRNDELDLPEEISQWQEHLRN